MGHVFAAAVAAGEERSRNPSWELQGSATNFFDIAGNPARAAEARVFRLERKAPDASEVPRAPRSLRRTDLRLCFMRPRAIASAKVAVGR